MLKKIFFGIFCVIDLYLLWLSVGFTITGVTGPKLNGAEYATFMGNYIMAITFGTLFLIATTLLIIFAIKLFKPRKNDKMA